MLIAVVMGAGNRPSGHGCRKLMDTTNYGIGRSEILSINSDSESTPHASNHSAHHRSGRVCLLAPVSAGGQLASRHDPIVDGGKTPGDVAEGWLAGMSDPLPQPTGVLISRLQRIARHFDKLAREAGPLAAHSPSLRAQANTCWQAAARLEEYLAKDLS
jgi:hypothetical protein